MANVEDIPFIVEDRRMLSRVAGDRSKCRVMSCLWMRVAQIIEHHPRQSIDCPRMLFYAPSHGAVDGSAPLHLITDNRALAYHFCDVKHASIFYGVH